MNAPKAKKIEKYIKTHDIALKEMINIKGYPVPLFWTKKNYKIADSLLSKTVAKDIVKKKTTYNSDVLNNLTIEKGAFIDIK